MGWHGEKYTWSNKQEDKRFTKERLDRMIVNQQWVEIFNSHQVETLPARTSDHMPLLTKTEEANSTKIRGSKNFKN